MKKKLKNQKPLNWGGLILIFVVVITILVGYHARHHNKSKEWFDSLQSKLAGYQISPDVRPVMILREVDGRKYVHGLGGILSDGNILTCGHAFWLKPGQAPKSLRYYYQVLQPLSNDYYPIHEIIDVTRVAVSGSLASRDVIVCIPGESKDINQIPGSERDSSSTEVPMTLKRFGNDLTTRSIVTGDRVALLGSVTTDGVVYFLLDYEVIPGQSGMIFVDEKHPKNLFIISQSLELPTDMREDLGLPSWRKSAALCSSVSLD